MVPELMPLAGVARALGSLVADVVFVGGAIAPLLQIKPPFPRVRPTTDVDGVIASMSYREFHRVGKELGARGFRRDITSGHAGRWIAPEGTPFDLSAAGDNLGGTGNPWDAEVIAESVATELVSGLTIRHASGPGFLALKWAAFRDRGQNDPLNSHDLEDILALIASRPNIGKEVTGGPEALRGFVMQWAGWLLAHEYREDLLAAHLNNATDVRAVMELVRERLRMIAGGSV